MSFEVLPPKKPYDNMLGLKFITHLCGCSVQ